MSIGLFIAAALLCVFALAVRLSGSGRILNFVDYEAISDRFGLHIWVGNRLLGLAAITGLLGLFALFSPGAAIFFLLAFIAAVVAVLSWLVVGASAFQARH